MFIKDKKMFPCKFKKKSYHSKNVPDILKQFTSLNKFMIFFKKNTHDIVKTMSVPFKKLFMTFKK